MAGAAALVPSCEEHPLSTLRPRSLQRPSTTYRLLRLVLVLRPPCRSVMAEPLVGNLLARSRPAPAEKTASCIGGIARCTSIALSRSNAPCIASRFSRHRSLKQAQPARSSRTTASGSARIRESRQLPCHSVVLTSTLRTPFALRRRAHTTERARAPVSSIQPAR